MVELIQLGRYHVQVLLGQGHFAEVYRAVDTSLDRAVALKVLKPALAADGEALARFLKEARTLANLVHPRIAWVWELGEEHGRYFIALRLVEGSSLDKLIRERGKLPWVLALQILVQAAEGLHFAHQKGLVHRDVKPQNILFSEQDGAVLSDFGLVKLLSESGVTSTNAHLGTPAYMAPEVWRNKEIGPQADQYALACVLVEMLTGKVLFAGDSAPEVMTSHIIDTPVLPEHWPADVPPGLSECLLRALAKQPTERFADLPGFVAALEALNTHAEIGIKATEDSGRLTAGQDAERLRRELSIELAPGVTMEFVRVPAGDFRMGSDPDQDKNARRDELPQHRVYLDEYLIGKYSVTNRQYEVFAQSQNMAWKMPEGKEQYPAGGVSWYDAATFCEWLSQKSGLKLRLPTEAEWEKAARSVDGRLYPWGNDTPDRQYANYNLQENGRTPVGQYSPLGDSPYGCADMAGNVCEWVGAWYKAYPGNSEHSEYFGEKYRVLRGSAWYTMISDVRSAFRDWIDPTNTNINVGFRCAYSL